MTLSNKKNLLLLTFLLLGVGLGVYILQFTRIFRSKAAIDNASTVNTLTQELFAENNTLQATTQTEVRQSKITSMLTKSITRKQLLLTLAKENPHEFLKQARLSRVQFPSGVQENIETQVDVKGIASHQIVDDFQNKQTKDRYYLTVKKPGERDFSYEVLFAGAGGGFLSGQNVSLKAIKLDSFLILDSTLSGAREHYGTQMTVESRGTIPSKNAKVAYIMMNFQDNADEKPYTKEQIAQMVLSDPNSVQKYYQEASSNQFVFSADVFGWYTIPTISSNCDSIGWADLAAEEARKAGVDLSTFNYYSFIIPPNSCYTNGGIAILGGNQSWIFRPTAELISHELGHNFGLAHASSFTCGTQMIDDYTKCHRDEYGDYYDVMGSGYNLFNAPQDNGLALFPDSQVQPITQDGTYTLVPLKGPNTGSKVLRIPKKDTNEFYYLQYRQPFGTFDSTFYIGPQNVTAGITRGASIMVWNGDPTVYTKLLDATPSTSSGPAGAEEGVAMADNQTFNDPFNGLLIKQLSHTSSGVTIDIKGTQSNLAEIAATPHEVNAGEPVSLSVFNHNNPSPTDWVGVFDSDQLDSRSYHDWFYLGSCSKTPGSAVVSNTCSYKTLADPQREVSFLKFRLFRANSFQATNTSNLVTLNSSNPAPTVSPTPAIVQLSAGFVTTTRNNIQLRWSNIAGPTNTDWVALYKASDPDDTGTSSARIYKDWIYMGSCTKIATVSKAAGECTFTLPANLPAGQYNFRGFANNGFTKIMTSNTLVFQ